MVNRCSFLPQTFRKLIQIGRVVYLNDGPYRGKLAVVVDIIDCNKVSSGVRTLVFVINLP